MLHRKLDWTDLRGVRWLLEHGADPNAVSAWGDRALHHALARGNALPLLEALLDFGADPSLTGAAPADDLSAVAIAARIGRADALELFDGAASRSSSRATTRSSRRCHAATARDAGARGGRAADRGAARSLAAGNRRDARRRRQHGRRRARRSTSGSRCPPTRCRVAVWRERTDTVRLLLARGAPVSADVAVAGRARADRGLRVDAAPFARDPRPVRRRVVMDEYFLDTPVVRGFIDEVRDAIAHASDPRTPATASARASPRCSPTPPGCPTRSPSRTPSPAWAAASASGCCSAPATARSRCSRSSSRPAARRPSTTTSPGASSASTAARRTRRSSTRELTLTESRALNPGDFYALLPPRDDIHRVRTTSPETSVSIHLLTNDTGCVWRHTFDPAAKTSAPFRSGYVNVACDD